MIKVKAIDVEEIKPTKDAIAMYCEANGDAHKFIDAMMKIGKTFAYAEKQYYACKKLSYKR